MVNEDALRQFLVMAFEHLKAQDQALADVNTELAILKNAIRELPDQTLWRTAQQVRHTLQAQRSDAARIADVDDLGAPE